MVVKSTVLITKESCLRQIRDSLEIASNEELENALESLVGDKTLHNYSIVAQSVIDEENKRWNKLFKNRLE